MKHAKEGERRRKQQQEEEGMKDDDDDEDDKAAAVPGPEEDSSTAYVAYHDWEHYSSIRNLTGPHQGLPNIVEKPPQDEMVLKERPSPAPAPAPSAAQPAQPS